ncbi:protein ADM2 [Salvelinus fontinalis]|uniref:protein ADM2 n=1 Tax=Salvelinus fontinalis TaxID=8038 RepID=UPI00248514D0|nr:protein ADM2 [Salvelinus fontinalis]
MPSLFPAWLCCLSLLTVETHTLALPRPARTEPHRFILSRTSWTPGLSSSLTMATVVTPTVALDDSVALRNRWAVWRALLPKGPPRQSNLMPDHEGPLAKPSSLLPGQNYHLSREGTSRGRRHANGSGGRGQGQLMRVGCVLGTCQVQNLSHRLYQLIGQSGRQDSSPINPRSPHSYG